MELKILVLISLIVAALVTVCEARHCKQGWILTPLNKCYIFISSKTTWFKAQGLCRDLGATLAVLDSKDEMYWLKGYKSIKVRDGLLDSTYWIGGRKIGGQWKWNTFSGYKNMPFTDWDVENKEPNNSGGKEDCLEMRAITDYWGRWNDLPCTDQLGYICEQD